MSLKARSNSSIAASALDTLGKIRSQSTKGMYAGFGSAHQVNELEGPQFCRAISELIVVKVLITAAPLFLLLTIDIKIVVVQIICRLLTLFLPLLDVINHALCF